MILCILWSALWLFILLNERVYNIISIPIWLALLGAALLFLAFSIYGILKGCNRYLEVSLDEIGA